MSIFEALLQHDHVPNFYRVENTRSAPKLEDVAAETRRVMQESGTLEQLKPGQSVCIAAGSREIANIALIVRTVCEVVREHGAEPFIIPAMGSHAGAQAEGQKKILADFGITEEYTGAPIRSSMETVQVGVTKPHGFPARIDRYAAEADWIIPIGRIKPHTDIRGPIQSGVAKMLVIGLGKQRMKEYIHAVQPKLVRYTELVQEIRGKSKERKSLLAEKKETPFYLIPKQRELSRRIAELTEELEELKSEKDMLLHSLECSDDASIATVKKDISMLEAALKKLAQHEEKYTDELNDALRQYADLKEQAAEFDPEELQDARCALRPAMERSAVDCVQSAYGNKYDPMMMYDSKRDVANLLHEEAEERSIRERLRQKQQQKTKQKQDKKKSRDSWER